MDTLQCIVQILLMIVLVLQIIFVAYMTYTTYKRFQDDKKCWKQRDELTKHIHEMANEIAEKMAGLSEESKELVEDDQQGDTNEDASKE